MIEFTCGIYTAIQDPEEWRVIAKGCTIAVITPTGELIKPLFNNNYCKADTLIELAVLMNNIKRQYKTLNNA